MAQLRGTEHTLWMTGLFSSCSIREEAFSGNCSNSDAMYCSIFFSLKPVTSTKRFTEGRSWRGAEAEGREVRRTEAKGRTSPKRRSYRNEVSNWLSGYTELIPAISYNEDTFSFSFLQLFYNRLANPLIGMKKLEQLSETCGRRHSILSQWKQQNTVEVCQDLVLCPPFSKHGTQCGFTNPSIAFNNELLDWFLAFFDFE